MSVGLFGVAGLGNDLATVQADGGRNPQIVATAIENDSGTGAVITNPQTTSTDGIFGPGEADAIANSSIVNAGTWAGAAQEAAGSNEAAVLQALGESGANGGVAQPLGSQLSLQDVNTTSSTTAPATGTGSGVLIIGVLIVAGIAGYIYWKKKHKTASE
jgi:LPXTG-motif cell wall-anchored protein